MPKGVYERRTRRPKEYASDVVSRVRELYANGKTQLEAGIELGLSQKVIHTLMRRHNIKARVAAKRDQRGERNSHWKADSAGNAALHKRLYALFGKPNKCSVCGTEGSKHYDYANLTGDYTDPYDFAPMCRSCHWRYDEKIRNIAHMKRRDVDAQA